MIESLVKQLPQPATRRPIPPPRPLIKSQPPRSLPTQLPSLVSTINSSSSAISPTSPSSPSRIPIRTAKAEKRANRRLQETTSNNTDSSMTEKDLSPSEIEILNTEKRAAWRQARLKSLEQDALQAQMMIKNMNEMAEDLIEQTKTTDEVMKFPRIAVKSSRGALIVREREKIVDEKVIQRTEEVPCPITGQPKLRTVEYVEKIIETEVETCQEKIISLELQDPEREIPITPSDDDESASIVTIRTNNEKLFLKTNDDIVDHHNLSSFNSKKDFDKNLSTENLVQLQTIVEVVNPIIGGDGNPNNIAIGRSTDCTYPSFDDYTYSSDSYEHHQPTYYSDDSHISLDRNTELSLNAKMKNVLQELLENERVKLNLSRSLIETESDNIEDSDYDDDDDDDDDGGDDVIDGGQKQQQQINNARQENETNGNLFVENNQLEIDPNRNFQNIKQSNNIVIASSENVIEDDNSLVAGCHVYKNPNTKIPSYSETQNKKQRLQQQQQTTTGKIIAEKLSDENRTLREKFMSELHVNDKRHNLDKQESSKEHLDERITVYENMNNDDDITENLEQNECIGEDDEDEVFEISSPTNDDDPTTRTTTTKITTTASNNVTTTTTSITTTSGVDTSSPATTTTTSTVVKATANPNKKKKRKGKNKKK